MVSTAGKESSCNRSVFLLTFIFVVAALAGAECVKKEVIEEIMTAIVCVSVPGFIGLKSARRMRRNQRAFSFIRIEIEARSACDRTRNRSLLSDCEFRLFQRRSFLPATDSLLHQDQEILIPESGRPPRR